MKNLERFSTIFLAAGFICFLVAFIVLGFIPAKMTDAIPEDGGLPSLIPDEFQQYYSSVDEYQKALMQGRDIYVKEACWHCHSQYVRPVSNEVLRYGLLSQAGEYENLLNRPQLFGTRRVGPDLVREAGKRSNDWHFAHFYRPKWVVPDSVMPPYPWYFDETKSPPVPTEKGIALVAYIQSLGKWAEDFNRIPQDAHEITWPPEAQ